MTALVTSLLNIFGDLGFFIRRNLSSLGAITRPKGSTAIISMALNCSPAFIRPISAVKDVPARPANNKAVITGPNSRVSDKATNKPSACSEP
jgi:hypothetical protein